MRYWFDTEFVEWGRERPLFLLSIGLVAEDGREYYAQLHYAQYPEAHDWVARHVFPHLLHFDMAKQSRSCVKVESGNGGCQDLACVWRFSSDLRVNLRRFCDPDLFGKPEFWGYYADYDWVVLCQLFGAMVDLPKDWPMYCRDLKQWCDDLGNPELPKQEESEHNALADARWNKQAWEFLRSFQGKR